MKDFLKEYGFLVFSFAIVLVLTASALIEATIEQKDALDKFQENHQIDSVTIYYDGGKTYKLLPEQL